MRKAGSWGEIFRLSVPTVATYVGLMFMQLVDLIYVGRVSPAAVAGVGLSNSFYSWFFISGIGLFSALDFMISFRRGSGAHQEGEVVLGNGLILCTLVSLPLTLVLMETKHIATAMALDPSILVEFNAFHPLLSLTILPTFLGVVLRSYAQAYGMVRMLAISLVLSNLLNWLLNELLVAGGLGGWKLGTQGSGIATLISRIFLLVLFFFGTNRLTSNPFKHVTSRYGSFIQWNLWKKRLKWNPSVIKEIFKVGGPSALQFTFEVGAFSLAGTLSSLLGPVASAAHQICINIASLSFMIPHGVGTAAAVMIGRSYGENDLSAVKQIGNRCLKLVLVFMVCSGLVFLFVPELVLKVYTTDLLTIQIGKRLLVFVAVFQLADGIQGMLSGALRGIGDTQVPMWVNLISHWAIGVPLGSAFCFWMFRHNTIVDRISSLWFGLTLGLFCVAAALLWRWNHMLKSTQGKPVS